MDKISHQYAWQIKKKSNGLCTICGREQSKLSKTYCEKHRILKNVYQRERARRLHGSKHRYAKSESYGYASA